MFLIVLLFCIYSVFMSVFCIVFYVNLSTFVVNILLRISIRMTNRPSYRNGDILICLNNTYTDVFTRPDALTTSEPNGVPRWKIFNWPVICP